MELKFSESLDPGSLRLLEVSEELLSEIESGKSLMIKATADQDAVMCTGGCTYGMQFVETSNSVLLVPQALKPEDSGSTGDGEASGGGSGDGEGDVSEEKVAEIAGIVRGTYTLHEMPSRVWQLRELLERAPLDAPEHGLDPLAELVWEEDKEEEEGDVGEEKKVSSTTSSTFNDFLLTAPDDHDTHDTSHDDSGVAESSTSATVASPPSASESAASTSGSTTIPSSPPSSSSTSSSRGVFTSPGASGKVASFSSLSSPVPIRDDGAPLPVRETRDAETEKMSLRRQRLFAWEDLRRVVQVSDLELWQGLQELGAIRVGKHWRVLTPSFFREAMNAVLEIVLENRWSLLQVPEEECVGLLGDRIPKRVTRLVLSKLGVKQGLAASGTVALSIRRIAEERGKELLAEAASQGRSLEKKDFMDTWNASLQPLRALEKPRRWEEAAGGSGEGGGEVGDGHGPLPPPPFVSDDFDTDCFEPSLNHLGGLFVTEPSGAEVHIFPYDAKSLPHDPAKRFEALFRRKPQWTMEEIAPFLKDIEGPGAKQADLLLKYTRTSVKDGVRTLTQR